MKRIRKRRSTTPLVLALLRLPWSEALAEIWKVARRAVQDRLDAGMYEVLEHESTLELRDRSEEWAAFRKRELVRYL